jgi:acetoin utilization deacetylase AcuC-like enzyme
MKIIYSSIHKQHIPAYEVYDGIRDNYAEVPGRIEMIKLVFEREKIGNFITPKSFPIKYIQQIHQKEYINFLKIKTETLKKDDNFFASYFIMDTYAPLTGGTFVAAKMAVNVALTGAELIKNGEKIVYSLCRPPGHHAGYNNMGGYCYFNNAAIAANYLSQFGKVAILDIDYHHGNGTQEAFYHRNDVLYVSLHADPSKKFPYISGFANEIGKGDGIGFNKNYPLPLHASEKLYEKTLLLALQDVASFKPKFLLVSAGFDTYVKDPIAGFRLTTPFYQTVGAHM